MFAADHGVHAQGVTPWPQEVTAQMVANFLAGGAVVNAFAAQSGAEVVVVDVGVAADLAPVPGLLPRKIAPGHRGPDAGSGHDPRRGPAAVEVGIETARDLVAAGNRCLLTGDMGIANTTASAALIAAFTGAARRWSPGGAPGSTTRCTPARSRSSRRGPGPALPPTRPTRSGCLRRSVGSSTRRSPGSCSALPRCGYPSCWTA